MKQNRMNRPFLPKEIFLLLCKPFSDEVERAWSIMLDQCGFREYIHVIAFIKFGSEKMEAEKNEKRVLSLICIKLRGKENIVNTRDDVTGYVKRTIKTCMEDIRKEEYPEISNFPGKIKYYKKRKTMPKIRTESLNNSLDDAFKKFQSDGEKDTRPLPGETMAEMDNCELIIQEFHRKLNPVYKKIFYLRYYKEMSYDDIVKNLNLKNKQKIYDLREKTKPIFKKYGINIWGQENEEIGNIKENI